MRFNCVEQKRSAQLPWSTTAPWTFAVALSFQARGASSEARGSTCVYIYILYVCVYICVCVYVCAHVYMYIYACVYVFVHLCVYTHVYMYVYACLCIDCGSWYQCFSLWTVSYMRMCFRVYMYAYVYVCRYIYMCIFYAVSVTCTLQVFWALVHGCYMHFTGVLGTSAWTGVYVTQVFLHQRTHLRTHSLQVVHIYVYVYICVYACICIWMRMCVYDIA